MMRLSDESNFLIFVTIEECTLLPLACHKSRYAPGFCKVSELE